MIEVRHRAAAKLLPLDVGLAFLSMGGGLLDARSADLDTLLDGRMAEIFIGQQLLTTLPGYPGKLYFWIRDKKSGNAEVDYLIERVEAMPLRTESEMTEPMIRKAQT